MSCCGGYFAEAIVALEPFQRWNRVMMLGLSLSAFTILHVIISLIAIVAGLIVMFGMLGSNRQPGLTAVFLLLTILTSVTGFRFPNSSVTAGILIGILSMILLVIACLAL